MLLNPFSRKIEKELSTRCLIATILMTPITTARAPTLRDFSAISLLQQVQVQVGLVGLLHLLHHLHLPLLLTVVLWFILMVPAQRMAEMVPELVLVFIGALRIPG